MGFVSLFLVGIGLSMDAFAAAVCQGLSMGRGRLKSAMIVALFFGGFQAIMPWIGFQLGSHFAEVVSQVDHWIAFGLLAYLGAKMVIESHQPQPEIVSHQLDYIQLLGLSVATSLDALAVGVTFAFLEVAITPAVAIIGITTFGLSLIGVLLGHALGSQSRAKAQWTGGVVLILLGCKILADYFLA